MGGVYYFQKPEMKPARQTRRAFHTHCNRIIGKTGKQCCEPTEKGATYCADCARFLLTLTDRPAPETQRAKNHPWTEEGIQRATRAKRRA